MPFKFITDSFSASHDGNYFVEIKTLKKPRSSEILWLIMEFKGDSRYARAATQSVIEALNETFFEEKEGLTPYERFELALKEVNIVLKSIKERQVKTYRGVNAIIAAASQGELFLTQSGEAEAYLIRRNQLSMISEGLSSRSGDTFVNIASGEIAPDDKIVFSTTRLLRFATHSQLTQVFNDGVAEAIDGLKDLVGKMDRVNIGALALHTKALVSDEQRQVKHLHAFEKIGQALSNLWNNYLPQVNLPSVNLNQKNLLAVIGAVVLVLLGSIYFFSNRQRNQALREEYRIKLEALNQDIAVANTKGYSDDKEGANIILEKIEEESRAILNSSFFRAETLDLLQKVQDIRDNINNTIRVKGATPYIDLSKKKESVQTQGLTVLDGNLFAFEYNTLHEIILDEHLEPRLIDEGEVLLSATGVDDLDLITFLTQSGRVIEYQNGQVKLASTSDETWKSGVDIASFGRNIYILSPDQNQIFKYSRNRDNYSRASNYTQDVDLKGAISITIDGGIYVLKQGGDILRFYRGKLQNFRIDDLAVDLSNVTKIFTTAELGNLYLLDPVNKKVITLTKSDSGISRYVGEVIFEDIDNLKDFYVEEGETKLNVLTDTAIYRVDL